MNLKFPHKLLLPCICALIFVFTGAAANAEETAAIAPASESSAFIFNTVLFLISGMVVMFMAAGFCMLETGLVRSKNAATICLKNVAVFAIAGIMVWLTGYNLIYETQVGALSGKFFSIWKADDSDPLGLGYGSYSGWFFQMVFVATAASIVSGTVAERIKLAPFLLFTVLLTGFIYPIVASWEWGYGYLDTKWAFADFAGSTLVHSTGGWAALTGAIILGPRIGKYRGSKVTPLPGSSIPLAALGTFILWLGWFGFNGGSKLALGTIEDAAAVAKIIVNTNMSACGGVVVAMACTAIAYKKMDVTIVLNGAIGGLVAITAEPLTPSIAHAVLFGGIGGAIVSFSVPLLERFKIDDVVGAIPAHLFCGIWGTLIVPITNKEATFIGQLVGVLMTGLFVSAASAIIWAGLKYTIGIRAGEDEEREGLDKTELGLEAYPEFAKG